MAINASPLVSALMILGGAIYVALAGLHAIYTYLDARDPRRLVPEDSAVREAMTRSGVRLARGRGTMSMWDAWIGFNFSHSFGGLLLGGLAIAVGAHLGAWAVPPAVLALFVAVSAAYLVVGLRYWFRIPTTGIAVATACFFAAWVIALT